VAATKEAPMPRTSRLRSSRSSLSLLLAISSLAGCTATRLSSEPPEQLEVKATFADVEGAADGKQAVAVQFFEDGELVELTGGPTIRCNGVELARTGLGYVGRVALLPSGGTYVIEHSLRDEKAEMRVLVPPRPEITSPTSGAQLVRTAAQDIQFTPLLSIGVVNVMATAEGPGGNAQSAWQSDNGLVKVDTREVGVGPGAISVTREHQGQVTGSQFAGASFTYSIEKKQPVVWQ
jgi:hypothetical protein